MKRKVCISSSTVTLFSVLLAIGSLFAPDPATGAPPMDAHSSSASSPTVTSKGMVKLNFPNELDLKVLVDYVSQRLGMKILYDEEIANKKVSLRAPGEVPIESLLGVLQSALKMKGLALVDAEVPGWKRIVAGAKLPSVAPNGEIGKLPADNGAAGAVTQTFALRYADSQKVDQAIKTFLTPSGANSIAIKYPNVLIVTDYTSNLLKVSKMIELLDQPRSEVVVEFVPVRNLEAAGLVQQVNAIFTAKAKVRGDNGGANGVEIAADARTNQVVLVGSRSNVDEALRLIRSFDVPLGLETKTYPCRYVSPERVDRLVKQLVRPADAKRLYQSVVDAEGGLLVVTTTPEIHARLVSLRSGIDVPATTTQSPMRFYKLKNTTVDRVLETLRAMAGAGDQTGADGANGGPHPSSDGNTSTNGAIRLPLQPGQKPPASWNQPGNAGGDRISAQGGTTTSTGNQTSGIFPGGAKIAADPNTNSLIVWAEPSVQRLYEELITSLDRRRPQVLIEARIVAVDTSDSFSLGIELGQDGSIGAGQLLGFSSFGLSTISATTGAMSLIPGAGFNGTLVDPNIANLVLRAMSSNARARVLASPRVLVNDNTKGELESVLSMPFASVNASQTVATTSVGGNQDAGTTITVTPHISEGDHLQLEFAIEFSSFTTGGSANLPPPRQVDKVQSTVTIPDGHTVIVGGLNRQGHSTSDSGVPVLEHIPVLKSFFSNRSRDNTCVSLFVFIRPTILRDDKFKDLKFLSEENTEHAGVTGQYPASQPMLMR